MANLEAVEAATIAGARTGLEKWAEHVQGKAQLIAPKREGTLRASAAHDVYSTPFGLEARIYFPLVYAAVQHERTDYHHDEGQSKYLEKPFKDALPQLPAAVGAGIKLALRAL